MKLSFQLLKKQFSDIVTTGIEMFYMVKPVEQEKIVRFPKFHIAIIMNAKMNIQELDHILGGPVLTMMIFYSIPVEMRKLFWML